ncbi:hypothetical protein CPB97_002005 [Podila verticillata]|nr:hypothetical protein CPB97_002005 [Podila verticillata]
MEQYATLVGIWEMLALTHVLIICGLIVLPPYIIDSVIIIGQKVARESFDPIKIVLPVLYGVDLCAWCISLVCLVSLRLSARDPTIEFEIQDSKQTHSLEMSRSQSNTSNNITPRNQHLFNFRQSVISPLGPGASSGALAMSMPTSKPGAGTGSSSVFRAGPGEGPSTLAYGKGKETTRQYSNEAAAAPQTPTRIWTGNEKRSIDASAIYIPSDPRISQVVVTFREDDAETSSVPAPPISYLRQTTAATQSQESSFTKAAPEATAVYITNHNYGNVDPMEGPSSGIQKTGSDRFTINFSSGESLSDMIFKSSNIGQTHFASMAPPISASKHELELEQEDGEEEPLRRNRPLAEETEESRIQNFARIRSTETKVSLTLSSDSSSGMSTVSNTSSSFDGEESEESSQPPQQQPDLLEKTESQEGTVVGLAMITPATSQAVFSREKAGRDPRREHHDSSPDSTPESVLKQFSYPTIPTRRSSHEHSFHAPVSMMDLNERLEDQGIHPHDYIHQSNSDIPDDSQPAVQPNSSDSSHSLSSTSTKSTRSKGGDDDHVSYNSVHRKPIPASSSHTHEPLSASTSTPTTAFASHTSSTERISATAPFSPSLASAPVVPYTTITFTAAAVVMTSTPAPTPSPRPKPSLASLPLRYWRDRNSGPSSGASSITPGDSFVSSASSSFAQNYLTNTFSKKKKLKIPTIVIHSDEEDGEPPRVLSQKDIEYLSTMPPAPLRPLIQPWDEIPEEDDPDHMINEGYDYDDFQHPVYRHDRDMGGIEEENEEEYVDEEYGEDIERDGAMDDLQHDVYGAPVCDPYALDVPIEIDLQGFERDIKTEPQDI